MPFQVGEIVEYSWTGDGHFSGEGRVIEVLPGGRYRLDYLTGKSFPKEASIFKENQLRLGFFAPGNPANRRAEAGSIGSAGGSAGRELDLTNARSPGELG